MRTGIPRPTRIPGVRFDRAGRTNLKTASIRRTSPGTNSFSIQSFVREQRSCVRMSRERSHSQEAGAFRPLAQAIC